MADDRHQVTYIGQGVHGKNGGGSGSVVVRDKAALNAALRNGGVTTTKKPGSANAKANPEGQRQAKIANETGIIPPPKVDSRAIKAISDYMSRENIKQPELARRVHWQDAEIKGLMQGKFPPGKNDPLTKLGNALGVRLTGDCIGEAIVKKSKNVKAAEAKANAKEKSEKKVKAAKNDTTAESGPAE